MENYVGKPEETEVYASLQLHEHGWVARLTKEGGDGCCEGHNIVWGTDFDINRIPTRLEESKK